ncbi:hypothetical protein GUU61_23385 [Escherichia coli]|nr:hypothetical protein [Escherichia coli]EFI2178121.1 hypothetical protein [Escherichia coli]
MNSTLSAWRISSNCSINEVIKRVFEEKRLRSRTNIFINYSLPLLDSASKTRNIRHVVVTSTFLPEWCKEELNKSANQYSWLDIIYVDPVEGYNLNNQISKAAEKLSKKSTCDEIIIASLRLDDDDLLSKNYFETIDLYHDDAYVDFCISTPHGYRGLYDGENYSVISHENIPNNAYGMALIARYSSNNKKFTSNYCFPPGTHIDMDKRVPVILDGRKKTYLRTMGRDNDGFSIGSGYAYEDELNDIRKKHFSNPIADTREISNLFGIDIKYASIFEYLVESVTINNNETTIAYNKNQDLDIQMAFYVVDKTGNKILTTHYSNVLTFTFPSFYKETHQIIAFCKIGNDREKRVVNFGC